ncbi:MAG: hypothetical protein IJU23_06705 [Proteobacteria bacterium]|nr:hypothetical protein [Pseudomonadota bacterium]
MQFWGCDSILDVNGSFEESSLSGRVTSFVQDQDSRRYFRFHLRQFDDAIGGTFETFDLKGYSLFSQMPEIMDTATDYYYCGRIDYGYVRNDRIFVTFHDKEQRQWQFSAELGEKTLSGSLSRIHFNQSLVSDKANLEYYLPEDRAYLELGTETENQMILQTMKKSSARSLECLYYHKRKDIEFILPSGILNSCTPSVRNCENIKLTIIGKSPQHTDEFEAAGYQKVQTAHLDDIDIENNRIRGINLRENPYASQGKKSNEIFIATAILFRDLNANDIWDSGTEPILATLNHQVLVFFPSPPETDISGRNFEGESYPSAVFSYQNMADALGWYVYHDVSDENGTPWRVLKSATPELDERLVLSEITGDPSDPDNTDGCFATSDALQSCNGILPVLLN